MLGGKRSRGFLGLGLGASSSSSMGASSLGLGLGFGCSFLGSSFFGLAASFGGGARFWTGGTVSACFVSPITLTKLGWLMRVQKYLSTWGNSEVNALVRIYLNPMERLQTIIMSAKVTECPTKYVFADR